MLFPDFGPETRRCYGAGAEAGHPERVNDLVLEFFSAGTGRLCVWLCPRLPCVKYGVDGELEIREEC